MERYTIDRFENGWPVLKDEQGRTFHVPRSWVPKTAQRGNVVIVRSDRPVLGATPVRDTEAPVLDHSLSYREQRRLNRENRQADLHTQGVKHMFFLHGGGSVALLTFLSQIIVHGQQYVALTRYVTAALAAFCVGLVLLAPISHLRHASSRAHDKKENRPRGHRLSQRHRRLFTASVVCFALGLLIALWGVWGLESIVATDAPRTDISGAESDAP